MSKSTIQMAFDAEKLAAIKQYMGKKEADLNAELDDFMQKLYEKYVPAPVREYIESRSDSEEAKPPKQPRPRPAKDKTTPPVNGGIEPPARDRPQLPERTVTPASVPFTAPGDE